MSSEQVATFETIPIAFSVIAALALLPLPFLIIWRLDQKQTLTNIYNKETQIKLTTLALTVSLMIAEILKTVYFALEKDATNKDAWLYFPGRLGVLLTTNICVEIGHVLTFAVVLIRTIDLIYHTAEVDLGAFRYESMGFMTLFGVRVAFPLFAWMSLGNVSPFGIYQIEVIGFEAIVMSYASWRSWVYLSDMKRKLYLDTPRRVLFGIPIATGLICALGAIVTICMMAGYQLRIETDLSIPQNNISYVVPSLYAVAVGYILTNFYNDVKPLIPIKGAATRKEGTEKSAQV